jgi:hypothetical protein
MCRATGVRGSYGRDSSFRFADCYPAADVVGTIEAFAPAAWPDWRAEPTVKSLRAEGPGRAY